MVKHLLERLKVSSKPALRSKLDAGLRKMARALSHQVRSAVCGGGAAPHVLPPRPGPSRPAPSRPVPSRPVTLPPPPRRAAPRHAAPRTAPYRPPRLAPYRPAH